MSVNTHSYSTELSREQIEEWRVVLDVSLSECVEHAIRTALAEDRA